MVVIEVSDLTKEFGDIRAIDTISFTVEDGEIFGFLGPNGAGKTTTIRTLLGLLKPTSGNVSLFGADIHTEPNFIDVKPQIGYLPADLGFPEEVTGRQFLDYQGSAKGDQRLEELLELFTPPLDQPIREYSSGNRQLLGIVQAFMHDPDLVVMDEPTSGLDPLNQAQFNEFIRDEATHGTTFFFSSHVLSEVRRVCDRVGILRKGRLVGLEDIESLVNRGGKRVRVRLVDEASEDLSTVDGVVDITTIGDELQFTYAGDYTTLFRQLANYGILDVEISEPPLEDVFMHYYGESNSHLADDRREEAHV
ncbi:ATP-binding cassette domain-containing protein [Natronorubrum sp. FCH18a]|uniref:ABC transporter ATP-binding protein n=1 Tax=Natronorubrum sp. FCH18a TaxID=3447018 RepID=UPI003F51131F